MKTLTEQYADISNRLLERATSVKHIRPLGSSGTSQVFRKHYRALLELTLDLQGIADVAQQVTGDREFSKHLANIAASVAQMKATALARIAANTYTEVGEN